MIVFILFLSFITIETTLLPTDLLKGYDKRVHPYFINYQPLLVNFSVPSLNLQQFFGTQLMASFLYVVVVRWQDERLRFDPKDFNNATFICLPVTEIWVPTFKIANAVETGRVNNDNGDNRDDVEVRSDGTVVIVDLYYSKTICGTRTNRFPFDIQFCYLSIENLNLNQTLMRFQAIKKLKHQAEGNAEFQVINYTAATIKAELLGESNQIYFIATLERKTFYYTVVIVLPAALITTLTIAGVTLPNPGKDLGEPINIGLASMLAISITFTVVSDNIPRSETIPLLGWFVLICLLLCTISVTIGLMLTRMRTLKEDSYVQRMIGRLEKWHRGRLQEKAEHKAFTKKQIINWISYFFSFLLQLLFIINLLVFFSFAWNKDTYSLVDTLAPVFDIIL